MLALCASVWLEPEALLDRSQRRRGRPDQESEAILVLFEGRPDRLLSGPTSSFCQADTSSAAVLGEKLNPSFLECGQERVLGFGPAANFSFCRL